MFLDLAIPDYLEVGLSAGSGEDGSRMQTRLTTLVPTPLASMVAPSVEEPCLGLEAVGREVRGEFVFWSWNELEEIYLLNPAVVPVVHSDLHPLRSPA